MNKKTIGIIAISVVLGAFILVCVKEKVDDFNQNHTQHVKGSAFPKTNVGSL